MKEGGPTQSTSLEAAEAEAGATLAPPSGHPRFPLFDPLRGLAAVAILVVHVGIFTGGFDAWYMRPFGKFDIGVPVFFLLSGFLLYRAMLARRVLGLKGQRLRDYARNRAFRILPLYWLVLFVAAIVPGTEGAFSSNWWVYFGLLMNYPIYEPIGACATNPFDCGIPPAWSLGLELFFYATLPLIALLIAGLTRLVGRQHWVGVALGSIGVAALVSFQIQSGIPTTDLAHWLFFSPLGRAWWFGLGMGLAVLSVRAQQRGEPGPGIRWLASRPFTCWGAAIVVFLLAVYLGAPGAGLNFPTTSQADYLLQYLASGIVSALILIPAAFKKDGLAPGVETRAGAVLGHPALVWLGLISYGIFLWHFPVMIVLFDLGLRELEPPLAFPVVTLATLGVSAVLSLLTYRLVERPAMRWSRSRSRPLPTARESAQ